MVSWEDINRLLIESLPNWQEEGEPTKFPAINWLEREGISREAFDKLSESIWVCITMGVLSSKNDSEGKAAVVAGVMLGFHVGWEAAKQYSQPRHMSQNPPV